MAKNKESKTGQSLSDALSSVFAISALLVALIVSIVVFIFVMGNTANFEGGNPAGQPLPGNFLGIIYKGGYIVPLLMTAILVLFIFTLERLITIEFARGSGLMSKLLRLIIFIWAVINIAGAIYCLSSMDAPLNLTLFLALLFHAVIVLLIGFFKNVPMFKVYLRLVTFLLSLTGFALLISGNYTAGFIVMAIALLVFVFLSYGFRRHNAGVFIQKLQNLLAADKIEDAIAECDLQKGSIANVARATLGKYRELQNDTNLAKEQKILALQKEFDEAATLEAPMLSKNLVFLSTIASLAVLIGLIGNCVWYDQGFCSFAQAGSPDALLLQQVFLKLLSIQHLVSVVLQAQLFFIIISLRLLME